MKKDVLEISPRYIVDSTGKKTEVILDVSTFERMLEGLEDLYFGIKAEKALEEGEYVDFNEVNKENNFEDIACPISSIQGHQQSVGSLTL